MNLQLLTSQAITSGIAIGLIIGGIICFIIATAVIFLYRRNMKRKEAEERTSFKETMSKRRMKFQMVNFWSKYTYFFIIVVGFIAGLILLGIGIGALI